MYETKWAFRNKIYHNYLLKIIYESFENVSKFRLAGMKLSEHCFFDVIRLQSEHSFLIYSLFHEQVVVYISCQFANSL